MSEVFNRGKRLGVSMCARGGSAVDPTYFRIHENSYGRFLPPLRRNSGTTSKVVIEREDLASRRAQNCQPASVRTDGRGYTKLRNAPGTLRFSSIALGTSDK
jgi:hypothetical protein